MKLAQQLIYISQEDNDAYFNQRLPTWRDGYCYIKRSIHNVHKEELGFIGEIVKHNNKNIEVWSLTKDEWTIS